LKAFVFKDKVGVCEQSPQPPVAIRCVEAKPPKLVKFFNFFQNNAFLSIF